jgi:HEAT repeat protein
MQTIQPILLGLGLFAAQVEGGRSSGPEPAHLAEMLYDRHQPGGQNQAALLLVQDLSPQAENAVREGLQQTGDAEVFLALASAVRLCQDSRFLDELLAALAAPKPGIRQAAAATLAVLPEPRLVERLQAITEDGKADLAVRQAAVWALGRCGRKQAAPVLLELLAGDNEALRRAAADALTDLSGQSFGPDTERWRAWWDRHKDLSNERWLALRLAFQTSRAHRLEGELERARAQVLRLHQEVYTRLPVPERPGYVQTVIDQEDAAVRLLAVGWCVELLPRGDAARHRLVGQVLLRLSNDGDPEVQRAAVLALGKVTEPAAFDRLRELLRKGRPPVRAAAARALTALARGTEPEALARRKEVVPALQKALDDPAVEVVVEAAEDLGTLGALEAGPVLTGLLRHPSEAVRQAAAQALERGAGAAVLDSLMQALDDTSASVRFALVGALARAAEDREALTEEQLKRLLARLEGVLLSDADPGVRSRAATALGECAPPTLLGSLWKCVLAGEDVRVQEKAWAAFVDVVDRSASPELLHEWEQNLLAAKRPFRRIQLLAEIVPRWQKRPETKAFALPAQEALVKAQLEQGKWAAAFPQVRELLARPGEEAEVSQRLRWLLNVGEQALKDGSPAEARRVVQEAKPYLESGGSLAQEFDRLEKRAGKKD